MTTYYAEGSPQTDLSHEDLRKALVETFGKLEPRRKVLALPPDFTRANSMAGPLCSMTYEYFGDRLTDVMPALGTHVAMPDWQLDRMFPGVPKRLFRVHDWRNDVVTIGQVPAEFVAQATEGIYRKPWPTQLNRLVWEGGHDLILSLGQVVPHEVIGMANYNKNLFVGTGGQAGINESHFIGAAYGMERMMGRADTPLRRILNYAQDHFCRHLPVVFVLTVIGPRDDANVDSPHTPCAPNVRTRVCRSPLVCQTTWPCAACSSATTWSASSVPRPSPCRSTSRSSTNRSRKSSCTSIPRSSTARGWATRRFTARGWPSPTPASWWSWRPAWPPSAKIRRSTA